MSNVAPWQNVTPGAVPAIDTRYTQDVVPILDTSKFEHMQRVAQVMAECALVPEDLRKGATPTARMATCFLIVNQAVRWGMDPFGLAACAYVLHGKLGYEGKVIAAAINSDPRIKGRLDYAYSGEGNARTVVVSGIFRDSGEVKTVTGTFARWHTTEKDGKTVKAAWQRDPDQMLAYRGSRQWARLWMPDRLLGVYSDDELEGIQARDVPVGQRAMRAKDVTPKPAAPAPKPAALEVPDLDDAPAPDSVSPSAVEECKGDIAKAASLAHLRYLSEVWGEEIIGACSTEYDAKHEELAAKVGA